MAQGSKPRHSRSTRKPVTIDLEPEAVSEQEKKSGGDTADPKKTSSGSAAATSSSKGAARKSAPAADKKDETGHVRAQAAGSAGAKDGTTGATGRTSPADEKAKKATGMDTRPDPAEAGRAAQATDRGAAPPASGNGFRAVGAGLAGAAIALLALFALQWAGLVPSPGNAGAQPTDIIRADIDALRQSVASLEKATTNDAADLTSALQHRIDALEKTANLSAEGAGSTLSALETRVEDVAARIEDLSSSGQDNATSDLSDKVTALQSAHSGQQSDMAQLRAAVTGLSNTIAADAAKQDQALKALDDRLATIEKSLSAPREDIRVARALAAANLKAAIDRGGSFMAELEAFASVDSDSDAIGQLRSLAASGVPSRSVLLNEFPTVATEMINAARGSGGDTGWVGRLVDSASSLVQVRPVGEISGDSVEAIVARMENKLNKGDLQGAVDEWKTLPEASQKVSAAYEKDLQARMLVEKLVAGTVNAALPTEQTTGSSTETQQTGGTN